MNNQNDKLALAELMQGLGGQATGYDWLTELMKNPSETKASWETDPRIQRLIQGFDNMKFWTPLEALEEAISRIELLRKVKSWPNPRLAAANLDALRHACVEYMDLCAARRGAVTVDGFVTYIRSAEKEQAKGTDEHAVNVLTYHKAKGLEWPWVVLTDLDSPVKYSVFGTTVEAATDFDIQHPLAGRSIRYWPWPFGAQGKLACLDEKLEQLPLTSATCNKAIWEAQRLLYVGMTRAKDGLVLAIRKSEKNSGTSLKTDWLDALTNAKGEIIVDWPMGEGKQTLQIGAAKIPITNIVYGPEETDLPPLSTEQDEYLSILPDTIDTYPAGRVSPSGLGEDANSLAGSSWEVLHQFDQRMAISGDPEMNLVGNAVHGFFGADSLQLTEEEEAKAGPRKPGKLGCGLCCGCQRTSCLRQATSGLHWETISPGNHPQRMAHVLSRQQRPAHARLDRHAPELPEGFILLDHKDHSEKPTEPGQPIEESMKQYLPQMSAYIKTIEKATGKPVLETILHLPVQGVLVRLVK
jgi:ATP-dependent helicase/nuclease subunit A